MQNTIVSVSHDMGVHYQLTHKMLIMYAAKAVEYADTEVIFREPLHPYTLMLTNSLPTIGDDRARQGLPGRPPSLSNPMQGCHFAESVPQLKQTLQQAPTLSEIAHDEAKLHTIIDSVLKRDQEIKEDAKA